MASTFLAAAHICLQVAPALAAPRLSVASAASALHIPRATKVYKLCRPVRLGKVDCVLRRRQKGRGFLLRLRPVDWEVPAQVLHLWRQEHGQFFTLSTLMARKEGLFNR